MVKVKQLVQRHPTTLPSTATVQEAVEAMARDAVGACLVTESGRLVGLVSERDVMLKVVLKRRDPASTRLSDVMSTQLITIDPEESEAEAFKVMDERHIRHLPVVGSDGSLLGILSIRNLLHAHVEQLKQEVESLAAYIGADGPGG